MFLSEREKDRRYEEVRRAMAREGLDALLVVGNNHSTGSASFSTGSFRYLSDFYIFSLYGLLLFFREHEPVLLVPMELQGTVGKKYSWVKDVRVSADYTEAVREVLAGNGLSRCRMGLISMDSLPASTYLTLREKLPQVEFTDAASLVLSIRFTKAPEERSLMEKAAELNDGAYREVLKALRPGMKEYEVGGILEGYHRSHGADRTFNLVFSGRFPTTKEGVPFQGLPWCPGQKAIEKGDCVHLEMTTVYGGYWNQLVRIVCVGEENLEVKRFHQAARAMIDAGIAHMKRGTRASEFVSAMEENAAGGPFKLTTPMGHFCGLDLIEARVDGQSRVVLDPGVAFILHPRLDDGKGIRIILWGETYMMTEEGPRRLNQADDLLHTV